MENWFCMPTTPGRSGLDPCPQVKYYQDSTGQWFEMWLKSGYLAWMSRKEKRIALVLTTAEKLDCNKCRHKLACLVKIDCLRTFESK